MRGGFAIDAKDSSHASAARLAVQRLARDLDFDDTRAGRASILVTEAVTNMLKHASGGVLAVRPVGANGSLAMEILAIDAGPGMGDLAESSRDGVSTAGTPGTGLGAMRRLADEFDVLTEPGRGTIVRIGIEGAGAAAAAAGAYDIGAVVVPKPGETVCGDAWGLETHADGMTLLLADGLGHGPDASRAATSAVSVLHDRPNDSAIAVLDRAHGRLRATRGAALAVMRHDARAGEIAFAGVGNIGASVLHGAMRQPMVSHNGIVGHNVHKSQEFRYLCPAGALVVAHSDGLETGWDAKRAAALAAFHPSIIAASLFREHWRRRDDVAVVVVRVRG